MRIPALILLLAACVENAVLDPALYLVPSPPLVETNDKVSSESLWGRSLEQRTEKTTKAVEDTLEIETTTPKPAAVESRMFWPRYSEPEPSIGVQIPLTFSLSGTYGRVASIPTTVIGKTYTSISGLATKANSNLSSVSSTIGSNLFGKSAVATLYGNYGRSALAGSSYGNYGTVRVYGSDNAAAWSGWGNGKWGHYGKGWLLKFWKGGRILNF